jgi:type II secretory pathway component GspD/PulD (secretin)
VKTLAVGLLIACCTAFAVNAAEQELVTIQLSHRLAKDMAQLVRPLLGADETVIPSQSMLIVKASPAKVEEILALVKDLDKSSHRLLVTVAQGSGLSLEVLNARAGLQAQMDPRRPGEFRLGGRGHVYQTESRDLGDATQRVQTLDGQPAQIQFGQQVPVPAQGVIGYGGGLIVSPGIQYLEATTGFAVTPRLTGNRVIIEVAPWSDRMSREGGGLIDTQGAQTTIEAALGEWVELGGQMENRTQSESGLFAHSYSTRSEVNRIFVKVEDLDAGKP